MSRQLYRQEALDQLTTPEHLDRPFTLVGLRGWLPLGALTILCGLGVFWAFFGRIPDTVDGTGVIIQPGRVRALQSPFNGQIVDVLVRQGQTLHEGEVIAHLNNPRIRQELQQAKERLAELKQLDKEQARLDNRRLHQEQTLKKTQQEILQQSISEIQRLVKQLESATGEYAQFQRKKLTQSRKDARELNTALRDKVKSLRRLSDQKLVTTDTLVRTEAMLLQNNSQLTDLEFKLAELELADLKNRQMLFDKRSQIADLTIKMKQLTVGETRLKQEIARGQATRQSQLLQQKDRVHQLETMLAQQGAIRSPQNGRLLELALQPGQLTQSGQRIGSIELTTSTSKPSELITLAYFPVKSGRWIREGSPVRVTPTPVQRERFGSIQGKVMRVSPFPITPEATVAAVGNPEIVRDLIMKRGATIEVEIELERADTISGFRWTSAGPPLKFSAGTTARVRVTVEERAPITFLIPTLRTWIYGKGEDHRR